MKGEFVMLSKFISSLKQEFGGYNAAALTKDLMAGLTVAAVALPLALAFGVSSGADAASGLITAIIAGLIMSLLSGGYYQISGPTGAMAAILMSLVAAYGMDGVFIATLIAGIILLLAGILHLGKLTSFIPAPVITGFTSGIAVIIALGQVDNFFGTHSEGTSAIGKLFSYARLGFSPNLTAVGLGLFVVLFMVFFPKKLERRCPCLSCQHHPHHCVFHFYAAGCCCGWGNPKSLIPENPPAVWRAESENHRRTGHTCVFHRHLGMIESLLCGASAGRMTGVRLDANQELIAQGVGNILLPFFGGIPATAAIARTSVAIKSGAKNKTDRRIPCRWASDFHVPAGSHHVQDSSGGSGRGADGNGMENERMGIHPLYLLP